MSRFHESFYFQGGIYFLFCYCLQIYSDQISILNSYSSYRTLLKYVQDRDQLKQEKSQMLSYLWSDFHKCNINRNVKITSAPSTSMEHLLKQNHRTLNNREHRQQKMSNDNHFTFFHASDKLFSFKPDTQKKLQNILKQIYFNLQYYARQLSNRMQISTIIFPFKGDSKFCYTKPNKEHIQSMIGCPNQGRHITGQTLAHLMDSSENITGFILEVQAFRGSPRICYSLDGGCPDFSNLLRGCP